MQHNIFDLIKSRITIICGNYGSGKTELSLNLALALKEAGEEVTLVDLDIVNPYFRSSGREALLKEHGIRLYMPNYALSTVDVPSLPPQIQAVFVDKTRRVIFDVGGDDTGAAALGRYRPYFEQDDTKMLYVINALRPMSSTKEDVLDLMQRIEQKGKQQVFGLVNNTNMAWETTAQDLIQGDAVAGAVAKARNIPVVMHCGKQAVLNGLEQPLQGAPFALRILMRPEWMVQDDLT